MARARPESDPPVRAVLFEFGSGLHFVRDALVPETSRRLATPGLCRPGLGFPCVASWCLGDFGKKIVWSFPVSPGWSVGNARLWARWGSLDTPLWLGLASQPGYVADVYVSIWQPEFLLFVSSCANWKPATEEEPGIWMEIRAGLAIPHPVFHRA